MSERRIPNPHRSRKLFLLATGLAAAWLPQASAQQTSAPVAPMAADAHPSFEVVTIKPSDPNLARNGYPGEGRHVTAINQTVENILSIAYGIHAKQIIDAPEWLGKDHYDVDGVADVEGEPDLQQMQEMFQKLLANRFHLKFHREVRELPIYAITIAKGGPNLAPAKPGEHLNQGSRQNGGQRILKFTNMPMKIFALNMIFYLDRPVLDQTGLPGSYDFTLTYLRRLQSRRRGRRSISLHCSQRAARIGDESRQRPS